MEYGQVFLLPCQPSTAFSLPASLESCQAPEIVGEKPWYAIACALNHGRRAHLPEIQVANRFGQDPPQGASSSCKHTPEVLHGEVIDIEG